MGPLLSPFLWFCVGALDKVNQIGEMYEYEMSGFGEICVCQKMSCFSISQLLLQTSLTMPNFLNVRKLKTVYFFLWASINITESVL